MRVVTMVERKRRRRRLSRRKRERRQQERKVISLIFLQGKPVWTLEDGGNTCLAANDKENEIAIGSSAGHVTVYNTSDWSTKCVLVPPTGNKVLTLKYGCIRSKSDHTFLLVRIVVHLYVSM